MYVSGEHARCLREVLLQKGFACHNCGSVSLIIRDAQWATMGSLALDVDLRCVNCGTRATLSLSSEDARRCGFDEPYEGVR
jgi:DNA-directed RNA polymerase subunit RPC12/RpoP